MQSQVLLRWLARRACQAGVLSSRQIGVTVHALHQLELLTIASASTTPNSILPIMQHLCTEADGRSQANMLHAIACATAEQCSPRVTVSAELSHTLDLLQTQLVEAADSLTAPETILVMEALLKLVPFAGERGPLLHRRLLDEVQERSMALASVVERPVDLLGVTRVAVEAAHCANVNDTSAAEASVGGSSSLSSTALPSLADATSSASSWAEAALDQVLTVVQARLSTFADQDLISLMDVLTVRRPASAKASQPALISTSTPLLDTSPSPKSALRAGRSDAEEVKSAGSTDRAVLVDAARVLLDDVLGRAVTTVPNLSVAQLSAWLTRLVHLHLTEHQLLPEVVRALNAAVREERAFTVAQLSSVLHALTAHLPVVMADAGRTWADKELYVKAYAHMLHQLTSQLHDRPREDATVVREAQMYLTPVLSSVPETALDAYLQQAVKQDERMFMRQGTLNVFNSSTQVRVFAVLSASLEKGAAVLLRHFRELLPYEQAHTAAFAFHWHLYMPPAAVEAEEEEYFTSEDAALASSGSVAQTPKAVAMVNFCSRLPSESAFRKHRAVCGLVEANLASFNIRDVVEVLNEVVVAHQAQRGTRKVSSQTHQPEEQPPPPPQVSEGEEAKTDEEKQPKATPPAETTGAPKVSSEKLEAAAHERTALIAQLFALLHGPLQNSLSELHTAQLVRYLTSMSKMAFRTRAPYKAALLALKGRSLTSFEQISVLGVLARHHLRSPYVLYGIVRDLPQLGQTLHSTQKALLLKYLGQAGAQRLVKAPCAEGLTPGVFITDAKELEAFSLLELVFAFNGLVELRQNANAATADVLAELARRVALSAGDDASRDYAFVNTRKHTFYPIKSSTTLAELVVSLCRYGGPARGVTAALLTQALQTLRLRLTTSRSLFVDLTQLTWYWPCVDEFFCAGSVVWGGKHPVPANRDDDHDGQVQRSGDVFDTDEWAMLTEAYAGLRAVAQVKLQDRLTDIATSPHLRCNTFLWNQLACGIRFRALPPPDSREMARLWDNLDRKDFAPLLGNPQQLLDVLTVGLHRLPEAEPDAVLMLEFVKKHIASMRVQDRLQVWWYASQYLSSASAMTSHRRSASASSSSPQEQPERQHELKGRQVVQALRDAAKQSVLSEEKAAEEKLSLTEQRLLQSLV